MKKRTKKVLRIGASIFTIFFILLAILLFKFIYNIKLRITDISEYINPNNGCKVLIQAIGEPEFPFGCAKVKITLFKNSEELKKIETQIYNDGAAVREDNIKVEWYDEYVKVVIKGEEQSDFVYDIKYK